MGASGVQGEVLPLLASSPPKGFALRNPVFLSTLWTESETVKAKLLVAAWLFYMFLYRFILTRLQKPMNKTCSWVVLCIRNQ